MNPTLRILLVLSAIATVAGGSSSARAAILTETLDLTENANPPSPISTLAAEATFKLDTTAPTVLTITLRNTSTSVPGGFDESDQLLTALSFDLGSTGVNVGDPAITGGSVIVGPGSTSINFDAVVSQLTAGDDVSGEWGYANGGGGSSPHVANLVLAMAKHQSVGFGGLNRDGPANRDGPQGGLATDPPLVALSGLGAVSDTVVITLTLSKALTDLSFLTAETVIVEFGSDAAFLKGGDGQENPVPEPATVVMLAAGAVFALTRRHRRRI